ncbi:cytochrome P450 [Suillus plorans]|uniref:Cytochrome P450 n=1 Tax=Suillus plorans TaxID=116603 RepID=A0A9P7AGK0_9AGAM|nr:cytochrome P450 [Suillus plorans]KAG1789006.1 cytochrome P450 [Suillus plorans]
MAYRAPELFDVKTGVTLDEKVDMWQYVTASPGRTALLGVIYTPIIIFVLNILKQLVVPQDPSLPPEVFHWIPFIGSFIAYSDDPLNFLFECREKYGDVFTFTLLGRKVTIALGVKGNNFVLGGKSTAFSAEDAYTHLTSPIFGKDVVYNVPNEVFMEQKKFVKVGLSTENFWARTLQGKEVRSGLDKSFSALSNDLDGGFTPLNLIPLRDHEIAHIMIALLMAGQHTSSASSSWTLLHLAQNVEVQEALYQEQVDHFGNLDGSFRPMTYEGFRKLPVLDPAIHETLRMHPPILSTMRYVRSDVPVPSTLAAPSKDSVYVVPKGHYVLASAAVSQWDPTRWSDPQGVAAQAFKTYSDENGEKIDYGFGAVSKGTESPYQPFGAGRHRCIGEQFAYLQLGTVISNITHKVELRLEDGITEIPEHNYHTMITMPKKPRNVCYRRRRFD